MFKENQLIYFNTPEESVSETENIGFIFNRPEVENTDPEVILRGLENEAERHRQVQSRIENEIENKQSLRADISNQYNTNVAESNRIRQLLANSVPFYSELSQHNIHINDSNELDLLRAYYEAKLDQANYKAEMAQQYMVILDGRLDELSKQLDYNQYELGINESQIAGIKIQFLQQERSEISIRGASSPLSEQEVRRVIEIDSLITQFTEVIRTAEAGSEVMPVSSTMLDYAVLERVFLADMETNLADKNLLVQINRLAISDTVFTDPNFNIDQVEVILGQSVN